VPRRISVRNHNRLLWNFDGALGGKTGYTYAAQKCFVGAVQRNGATIIVAILGARDLWHDTKRLLEYGFDHYDSLPAVQTTTTGRAIEPQAPLRSKHTSNGSEPAHPQAAFLLPEGYVLQIAAFRERERAESVYRQMSDLGLDAFIEPTLLQRGEAGYRVRVGPYAELLNAQATAQDILVKSGYKVLILPLKAGGQDPGDPS
jgi:D-alanyl-D-alanine carboxypeptidase